MKRGVYGHEGLMVELYSVKGTKYGQSVEKVGRRVHAYTLDMEEVKDLSVKEIAKIIGEGVREAVEYEIRDSDEAYVLSKQEEGGN